MNTQQRLYDIAECEAIVEKLMNLRNYIKRAEKRVQDQRAKNDLVNAAEGIGDILHNTCMCGTEYLTAEYDDAPEDDRQHAETWFRPITTEVRKPNIPEWGDLDANSGEGEV